VVFTKHLYRASLTEFSHWIFDPFPLLEKHRFFSENGMWKIEDVFAHVESGIMGMFLGG
jgi:hypothetical protein